MLGILVMKAFLSAATLVALAGALVACGGSEDGGTDAPGRWTAVDVRDFNRFTVFWVGEEFGEWPLVTVLRAENDQLPGGAPSTNAVTLVYGECTPRSHGDGASCVPPLEIRSEDYCTRALDRIPLASAEGPEFAIRGARAVWLATVPHLVLYTGDARVTVMARDRETAFAVASALIAANGPSPSSSDEPLPPVTADC